MKINKEKLNKITSKIINKAMDKDEMAGELALLMILLSRGDEIDMNVYNYAKSMLDDEHFEFFDALVQIIQID